MSMLDGPIRSVVVVGGGIVGWSAAVALRRRVPNLAVTIVTTPPPPDAPRGRGLFLIHRMSCDMARTLADGKGCPRPPRINDEGPPCTAALPFKVG